MPPIKVAGYCRLSDKDERSTSIASQKKRIQEYCARYDLELLQIFVDDGKSGWTFDRPGFIELELFCKKYKEVKFLIIPHFDRFSRADPIDAMVKERYFRDKLKVKVLQLSEPPDTDTENPTFQMIRFMQAFAANEERNRIVERVRTGIRYKLMQGQYCGSAPYGYKNKRDPHGKGIIVKDEVRSAIVKYIFELYHKGYAIEEIRRLATQKGFHIKGNSIIQKILSTPVYAGLINVTPYKNLPGKIVKGTHQAIITESLYWQVQEKLGGKKYSHQKRDEVPLRGILKCAVCGKPMTAAPSKSRSGKYYWYYFCNDDRKENYSAIKVHGHMDTILDAISLKGDYFNQLKEKLTATIQTLISSQTKELMKINLIIRNAEQMITDIEEKYLSADVSAESYKKVMSEKKNYLAELLGRKEILNFGAYDYLGRLTSVLDKASNLRTIYTQLQLHSKQTVIQQIFGSNLKYARGEFRTNFLHPAFSLNGFALNELPIIIEGEPNENNLKNESVSPEGVEPNPLQFLESIFAIFAA